MPYRTTKFIAIGGLQIQFNTPDPGVMREWHEMLVGMLKIGLFKEHH